MAYVTITPAQLEALAPCDLPERLALFGTRKRMGVRAALKAGVSVDDVLWLAGRLGLVAEIVEFANGCATRAASDASDAASAASAAKYAASAASAAMYARYGARYGAGYGASAARYAASAAGYARDGAARDAEYKRQQADLIRLFGTK